MKNNIFIINGQKTCGKDYFIESLANRINIDSVSISTVDVIKKMHEIIGYKEDDPIIKEKFRAILSDSKDSIDKHLNDWTTENCVTRALECQKHLCNALGNGIGAPIFIHNREPLKIAFMVERFEELGFNVRTLKVVSDWQTDEPLEVTCHADAHVNEFDYDLTFHNTKDVDLFNKRVKDFHNIHLK